MVQGESMTTCPSCGFQITQCPECGYATKFFPRHAPRGCGVDAVQVGETAQMVPSIDRDYDGPWRNRGYTFYIQMCYQDELTGKWAKLKVLLDRYGLALDDYWMYYYPKKKEPEKRPTAC